MLHSLFDMACIAGSTSPTCTDRGLIRQVFIDMGADHAGAHTAQVYLQGPIHIVVILVAAFIVTRLINRLAGRLVHALRLVSPLVRATDRGQERIHTITSVFASVSKAIIWVIAVLAGLGELRINLAPFIATATILGAALGFGAQTLVKDFLSGVLILAEDQYGIGDHIMIGTGANITSGTVESLNLRVTRLRALDGVVYYVPNGDIRTVGNDTETESQALVDVVVPLGTDLPAAGAAAEEAAREMAAEDEWSGVVVGQPVFAGVQSATDLGVTIRVTAMTRPGQHYRVARELRLRVLERLRRNGLAWVPGPQP